MNKVPFTKMQSLGNDFVIWDATIQPFNLSTEQIKKMSNRRFGIGFDQLMVLENPKNEKVDFNYRIFNADGNEVEQCGNGVRCLVRFIQRYYLPAKFIIKLRNTLTNKMISSYLEGEVVRVEMGLPEWQPDEVPFIAPEYSPIYSLKVGKEKFQISVVSMGNPHAILKVDSVDAVDVASIGSAISHHERFPKQVNVGFMQVIDRENIRLRVYERGVGETLACGSGACAAVAVGHLLGDLNSLVNVQLPGGSLQVQWAEPYTQIEMIGSGQFVYTGVITL